MARNKKAKKLPRTDIIEDQADNIEQVIAECVEHAGEHGTLSEVRYALVALKTPGEIVGGTLQRVKDCIEAMKEAQSGEFIRDNFEQVHNDFKRLDEYLDKAFKVTCRRPSRTWTWNVG